MAVSGGIETAEPQYFTATQEGILASNTETFSVRKTLSGLFFMRIGHQLSRPQNHLNSCIAQGMYGEKERKNTLHFGYVHVCFCRVGGRVENTTHDNEITM